MTDENGNRQKGESDDSPERESEVQGHRPTGNRSSAPEPPSNWKPNQQLNPHQYLESPTHQPQGNEPPRQSSMFTGVLTTDELMQFGRARSLVSASQICSVISLFIGGILVSSVALVIAIVGSRPLFQIAKAHSAEPIVSRTLRRAAMLAIGMSALVLIVNIISFVLIYPLVIEAMQSGDLASLFTHVQNPSSAGSANSTWG